MTIVSFGLFAVFLDMGNRSFVMFKCLLNLTISCPHPKASVFNISTVQEIASEQKEENMFFIKSNTLHSF